jgi:hypothetical protein
VNIGAVEADVLAVSLCDVHVVVWNILENGPETARTDHNKAGENVNHANTVMTVVLHTTLTRMFIV